MSVVGISLLQLSRFYLNNFYWFIWFYWCNDCCWSIMFYSLKCIFENNPKFNFERKCMLSSCYSYSLTPVTNHLLNSKVYPTFIALEWPFALDISLPNAAGKTLQESNTFDALFSGRNRQILGSYYNTLLP